MASLSRDIIGRQSPKRVYEFGDKVYESLKRTNELEQETHERSGKISGGKLGKPTLWAVLDLIGVPDVPDPYLLGKFKRGNDVEDRAINFLTGIEPWNVKKGEIVQSTGDVVLKGDFILQKSGGYRGGVGYIDLAQIVADSYVYHEIKSSTKMAYDKVAASGRYRDKYDPENGIGVPYVHHAIQLAYYCLGDEVTRSFLHYLNADDYRLTTFAINPFDYKEEIDKEIDDIQSVFLDKRLPEFEAFLPYHKAYKRTTYGEWNDLNQDELMNKLKNEYPLSYQKLMDMVL